MQPGIVDRCSQFSNRREAGSALAAHLKHYAGRSDVSVLCLSRGGVPVAAEVARALGAPLDVFVVRKLIVPGYRELAMGAVASGGVRVLNLDVVKRLRLPRAAVDMVVAEEEAELARRERVYRGDRPPLNLEDRIVILVDDGLATCSAMRAAVEVVSEHDPARIVVAVPAGARDACQVLEHAADEVVCVLTPEPFSAVDQSYLDFSETNDADVRAVLTHGDAARAA